MSLYSFYHNTVPRCKTPSHTSNWENDICKNVYLHQKNINYDMFFFYFFFTLYINLKKCILRKINCTYLKCISFRKKISRIWINCTYLKCISFRKKMSRIWIVKIIAFFFHYFFMHVLRKYLSFILTEWCIF